MLQITDWFQLGSIPANAMVGNYDLKIVGLSYVIAILASYVALNFAGRLRAERDTQIKLYWILGGAFAMGAGIWSMHFIGMLAFVMSMPMSYQLSWTISSLLVAIGVSGFALYILGKKRRRTTNMAFSGVFIGLGIASMHYMGMQGMSDVSIHYLPGWFFTSIVIAIFASEAALWLALQSNQGSSRRQFNLKILSALVMGMAICGMHYSGMAAAVFTPLAHANMPGANIQSSLLAWIIAGVTALIISFALAASIYHKSMMNAVQNEKEFLKAMLRHLEDGIIACDANGVITVLNFNNSLQKNLHSPIKHNSYTVLSDYFHFSSQRGGPPLNEEDSPLFRTLQGERIHDMSLVMTFKNGMTFDVVIDGQAIMNAEDKKLGAVIVIHDVTEIKKTEMMKSEFVSIVSHELRTPLTSIRGSLGLILGGTVGSFSDKADKLLNIANKNCERLLLLINDILDMEKIQANKMSLQWQVVDLNTLINETIVANKMYGEKFGVNIELQHYVPNINVYVDPDRFAQVLTNLISNAVKFSPQGKTVTISTTRLNGHIRIGVIDRGPGIPDEFKERIFQKFSQADSSDTRAKGGTGLGLSISKAIVEKLGGSLSFDSNPQDGTIFYVDLPIYYEDIVIPKAGALLEHADKRLLICEDDIDQAQFLSVLLESEGYHTDMALSVSEAKKKLAKHHYDALLLDLILPDQDGITFIKELRQVDKTRTLPIIVLSVIAETGHSILNGDAFLVVDWLEKPVNVKKLLQAISSIKPRSSPDEARILHVEDDVDIQVVVSTLLEKKAAVTPASTIRKAKEELAMHDFDLIILDLLLPDGNGVELISLCADCKLPIIVYSAIDLDRQYAIYVKEALNKSKTTNTKLLNTITKLLNEAAQKTLSTK
jgi:signal transduction histidine kinase/NO-binding membrane sensor protein with MHYT domain/DNA-binding response OmpR family regulator